MERRIANGPQSSLAASFLSAVILGITVAPAVAQQSADSRVDDSYSPQIDVRGSGVLAQSYAYHRQPSATARITPKNGWHHYGFPVSSYRWGWFGAERYYPFVYGHRGYNGDYTRVGYRNGY